MWRTENPHCSIRERYTIDLYYCIQRTYYSSFTGKNGDLLKAFSAVGPATREAGESRLSSICTI